MTPQALRDAVRRHVLGRVTPGLGSRVLQVGEPGPADVLSDAGGRLVIRVLRSTTPAPRSVAGSPDHLPVQSGAFTGVLYAPTAAERTDLVPALTEALRVLQPGGRVVMPTTLADGADAGVLEAAIAASGLVLPVVLPVRPAVDGEEEGSRLPAALAVRLETRRARQVLADGAAAEVVVVAVRPGGVASGFADLPDLRQTITSMFIPTAWTRKRRR